LERDHGEYQEAKELTSRHAFGGPGISDTPKLGVADNENLCCGGIIVGNAAPKAKKA
jgi:hypothetical protein